MQTPKKQKFNQKYKQLQLLGQGKMGVVYKVQKKIKSTKEIPSSTSSSLKSQPDYYAAKHISLSKIDIQVAKKQLKIMQQLKHMYIVRIYEDFVQNDELILVMDYCQGKDLDFLINQMKNKGKYFNQSLVSTWIFQLILVIQYIHSCNIIHRDIKPQNVFVDQNMNLKIGDFGVSKLLDGTQNCKTTAGTPYYCSPQVTKSQPYSKKTDIWSLGCVIYQICALQKPFQSKTGLIQLMNQIQTREPKPIPKIYSTDLNKLIKKMLIKDPKKRPGSRQLLQDPITVQLMINYSSQINLKQQYQQKPLDKPTISDSFIQIQSNVVNDKLLKFQEEVKQKMQSLKNKKVKTSDIDKYYSDIQSKMRNLQKIVDAAFNQLKNKSQPDSVKKIGKNKEKKQEVLQSKSKLGQQSKIKNNSSNFQQSDETIQSVNLGNFNKNNKNASKSMQDSDVTIQSVDLANSNKITKNKSIQDSDITIKSVNLSNTNPNKTKTQKQKQKQLQQKILAFNQSSSIQSVNSVFIATNKNVKNDSISSLGNSSLSNKSLSKIMKKQDAPGQLQTTLKSQYAQTIKKTNDINQVRESTLNHIDQVTKQIMNNPNLILDQTFLDVTLSLSNNQLAKALTKAINKNQQKQTQTSFDKSYSSSGKTISFDFSKKQYQDTLLSGSKKSVSQNIISEGQKDSLQQYQPDFDSYEEDTSMDIREQQKQSVKNLFTSTLKNLSIGKNDSNSSSYYNPSARNKYSMTLSTIREQSSQGGSTISYQQIQ